MAQFHTSTTVTIDRALDAYLVVSARLGDRTAFDRLARRWNARLLAHAWRLLGDADLAADAAQGAWVEIARGLDRLQDEAAFPAWAYRIVSRQCARRIGQLRHGRTLSRELANEAEIQPEQPQGPAQADQLRLRAAVRALPAAQRAAVALFYFEELSVAEVAVALDVPAGTVKTRLMHARQTLRSALQETDHA